MSEINKNKIEQILTALFEKWSGIVPENIESLPMSGSSRLYFRLSNNGHSAIGVYNNDKKENLAFIKFTENFQKSNLNVPKIYGENLDENCYLQEDLGNTTFFEFINQKRVGDDFTQEIIGVYKTVIDNLPLFQIVAGKTLDYSFCYPRNSFDQQSMEWDLNYFKYYFLKLSGIPFDEQKLEDNFQVFSKFLLNTESNYFLYRDFQSRNIMIHNGKPYFIDYQGGRKGALQYDIASLLYDAKANIPNAVREELLNYYILTLKKYIEVDEKEFKQYFYGFVLIRIMQALGAYGFRGFYEKKEHFLLSIPYALENLKLLLKIINFPVDVSYLLKIINDITNSEKLKSLNAGKKLKVIINSFSFHRGIPVDESGNGGGFVFDCRALHNPGRYPEYKEVTGSDAPVIAFLEKETDIKDFLTNVFSLVNQSVEVYSKRKFENLMINFGCTGGQHRSVYCANQLAKYLSENYKNIDVIVRHREQEIKLKAL